MVDEIKAAVDTACKGHVASCADILAIAARDSVAIVSTKYYIIHKSFIRASIINYYIITFFPKIKSHISYQCAKPSQ